MNDTPSVAVICTPNNRTHVPFGAIDSIIKQTVKPERMIVVHGKSETQAVAALRNRIEKVMPTSQLICIEHDPDTTFIAARNVGLNHVDDCRYIHFVNSDIQLPEDFYQKATDGLASRRGCALAIPARVKLINSRETEINSGDLIENPWLWLMRAKSEIAGALLLRSDIVERAGKFNPLLWVGADADFLTRLSNLGAWRYIPDCAVSLSLSQTETDTQLQFPDYHRRWALIYENLLDTYGARQRIARKTYRAVLAKAWCKAGRELLSHRRIEEARDCFMRSLSWQLFNPAFKYLMRISRPRGNVPLSDKNGI